MGTAAGKGLCYRWGALVLLSCLQPYSPKPPVWGWGEGRAEHVAPSPAVQLPAEPHEPPPIAAMAGLAGDPHFPSARPPARARGSHQSWDPPYPRPPAHLGWLEAIKVLGGQGGHSTAAQLRGQGPPQGCLSSFLGHPGVPQPWSPHPGDPQRTVAPIPSPAAVLGCAGTCLVSLGGGDAGPLYPVLAPGEQDLATTGVSWQLVGLNPPQLPPCLPVPWLGRGLHPSHPLLFSFPL